MRRSIYTSEHDLFRDLVRSFLEKEVAPQYGEWEQRGGPPREIWRRAGELGILGIQVPEEFGGAGVTSFKFNTVLGEESQAACLPLGGFRAHMDIVLSYLLNYCSPEQKQRWLPGVVSGETILAIGMTEPGAGSDVAGISATAVRDGDDYVINGAKTFISNGISADLIVLAVKTDPTARRSGISLIAVEGDRPGVARGRNLEKIGLHGQETAELFYDDVRVPAENLLGEEGEGFAYLTANLPQERLSIAVSAQAAAAAALRATVAYVTERKAFGKTVGSFQNTKFELAACATEVHAGQVLIDWAIEAHDREELDATDAAMVKLFTTETQGRVVDRCLQLHGGYGYCTEYLIARYYADARVTRIYGGSSEIMKVIVAKALGL
jgi:alkylation response protein AidB-like acyl-CoA dehydrogenase